MLVPPHVVHLSQTHQEKHFDITDIWKIALDTSFPIPVCFSKSGFNTILWMGSLKHKNEKEYAQILEVAFDTPWFSFSCPFFLVFKPHGYFSLSFLADWGQTCWQNMWSLDHKYSVPGTEDISSQT